MAKRTYVAKRGDNGWNIFDDKGQHETRTGTVNVSRSVARRDAFLLNKGRLVIPKAGKWSEPPVARFVPTDSVAPHAGERDFNG